MSSAGQTILTIGGAVAGFFLGGPIGALRGAALGYSLGGALFQDPIHVEGPKLSDLRVTGGEYGQPIPWLKGHPGGIAGQYWWNSDRRQRSHTSTVDGGGKGTAPDQVQTTYTWDFDVLVGLSANPLVTITRIFDQGELIWTNLLGSSPESLAASVATERWKRMTIYPGHDDQLPDPVYEAAVGSDLAVAYRGRGSVFFEEFQCIDGAIPNLTFEIQMGGEPDTLTIVPFYTLPDDTHWTIALSQTSKIVPTNDGRKMWFSLTPEYDNGWYQGGRRVGLYDHSTHTYNYITPDLNRPIALVSNGITFNDRVWAVWDTGSGLVNGGAAMCFHTNGNYYDVGVPSSFLNSNGSMGVSEVVEARVTGIDNSGGAKLFYTRQRLSTSQLRYSKDLTAFGDNGDWAGAGLDLGTAGNAGFNSYFLHGANRIIDRIYFDTRSGQNGIAWVHPVANTVTIIRAMPDTGFTPPKGVVGWDGNIYVADYPSRPSYLLKLDRDGALLDEVDTGITINDILDDRFGNLFIRASNNTVHWYEKLSLTFKSSVALLAASDTIIGDNSYYGFGAFVANSAVGDTEDIRLLLSPNQNTPDTLENVVRALCLRAGLREDQFDVSELASITRPVHGLVLSQVAPTRQALDLLMSTYFFQMVVSDKVYFVPRGGAPVVTIPYEDLGASDSENRPQSLEIKELGELEIPAKYAMTHWNMDDDYQLDTQQDDRIISSSETTSPVQVPLVFTPPIAKSIVQTWKMDQWASRFTVPISVGPKYAALEPADVIRVVAKDGTTLRFRVNRREDAYPMYELELSMDDPTVLQNQGITSVDYTPSLDVDAPSDTVMYLLDIPILRDFDNDAGPYVATRGSVIPHPGSFIYKSTDDLSYSPVETVSDSTVSGTCTTILGNYSGPPIFDLGNSVTVNVGIGILASATRETLLADPTVNVMVIGDEIIQFMNAALISPGVYKLTHLLRGLRGTEWARSGHIASERAVKLQTAGLRRLHDANSAIGASYYYRGVTIGRKLTTASPVLFTNLGVGLRPFSPSDLRASYNVGTGDITLTPFRRSRLATRGLSTTGQSIPLGEETETYRIEVYSDGTFTTIERTIDFTGTSVVYTNAQQTADFGSVQTTLHLRCYQMSAVVGASKPLEIRV